MTIATRVSLQLALTLTAVVAASAHAQSVDVLLSNGTVYDGSGARARRADVGWRGDRITFVGDARAAKIDAVRTIDATGLIVAPGFIDPHTHSEGDLSSTARHANTNYLMQGVTTVATNNDGGGSVHIGAQLATWDTIGIGTNALLFVPQGSVRQRVMGMSDRPASDEQIDRMRDLVEKGMKEGAFGLSTGLYYAPGSYASTEEVIALARVAAIYGGIYDTHQRDEGSFTIGLLASVREVLRIGREAAIPVHFSHIKALGTDAWGRADSVIALVRAAQRAGVTVSADQYPYEASGTSVIASIFPRWAEAGGRDSLLARIGDPVTHARLLSEVRENLRRRGGPKSLLIVGGKEFVGERLEEIAAGMGREPAEAAFEIVRRDGDLDVASFNMIQRDIETFMKADFVTTGSDGSDGHPRKFGTFPKKLRDYVLDRPVITMERMIAASSAQTARDLGIPRRGRLEPGWYADVIVFDPMTVRDLATWTEPRKLATGMWWVFVNGRAAVEAGAPTGSLAGKALRHGDAR